MWLRLTTTSFSASASKIVSPSRCDPAFEHAAVLDLVVAGDHRREHFGELAHGDVGDEAEPPLVDAHQRQAEARQLARDAEHRAVSAEHHRQVALAAEFGGLERAIAGDAGGQRRLLLERHVEPLADQEMRDVLEHPAYALGLVLAHERGMTKAGRHARDYTTATRAGAPQNRAPP